ncbi:hypothetical protein [Vibrio navarrensis]|uniref:hypothetical protein n=1 Tax=Vibrio navarrensis TaxID=29495 RepID=UPI00338DF1F8
MSVLIISPTSSLTARTRLYKIARLVTDKGQSVIHWGWKRSDSDILIESDDINIKGRVHILSGGGYNNCINKAMYVFWGLSVFFRLLLAKRRTVWALGLETAFPAVLASIFRNHKVIFDDADRLILLFNFQGWLYRLVRRVEIFVSTRSHVHLVPSKLRYDYSSDNFFELKNLPTESNVKDAYAKVIPPNIQSKIEGKVVIYANGWLSDTRGSFFIIDLINKIKSNNLQDKVVIILAGRIDSYKLQESIDSDFCILLKEMKYEDALSYYKVSTYVLTLYDPKIAINRYAEANKWGDALAFGVIPVVNKEIITAGFLRDVALFVDYNNSDALLQLIFEPRENGHNKDKMKVILDSLTPFEVGILRVLEN